LALSTVQQQCTANKKKARLENGSKVKLTSVENEQFFIVGPRVLPLGPVQSSALVQRSTAHYTGGFRNEMAITFTVHDDFVSRNFTEKPNKKKDQSKTYTSQSS